MNRTQLSVAISAANRALSQIATHAANVRCSAAGGPAEREEGRLMDAELNRLTRAVMDAREAIRKAPPSP